MVLMVITKPWLPLADLGHTNHQFLRIDFDEAALAAYLPVQQFRKAGTTKVWSDSRGMI